MNGNPEADRHDGDRARRTRRRRRSRPVVSYQCAIDAVTSRCFPSYALRRRAQAAGAVAQFEFLLIAAAAGRGLGGVGARPRGRHGHVGRAVRAGLPRSRRAARRAELRAAGPVAVGADRPVGLLRRRPGHRVGRRDERLLRARTQHRRRRARIARRRPRPHLPPAQRHASMSGLPAMVVAALAHVYPDLDRVIQEHATDEGKAMLQRMREHDHRPRRAADGRQGHGRLVDRPLERDPRHARGPARLRQHQARHGRAHAAGADRAGRA